MSFMLCIHNFHDMTLMLLPQCQCNMCYYTLCQHNLHYVTQFPFCQHNLLHHNMSMQLMCYVNVTSYTENFYETSTLLGKVWLQVGFEPTPLTFWASTLTTRPLMPPLLSALIQGLSGRPWPQPWQPLLWSFVYRRHLPPVQLVLRCLSDIIKKISMKHPLCWEKCAFRWDSNPCLSHSGWAS